MSIKHQHYWIDTGIPHPLVFLNRAFRYDCSVCDKKIYRRNTPINPIVPSAWEVYSSEVQKGNAAYVMSPPMILLNKQESDWSEGERYKRIIMKEN